VSPRLGLATSALVLVHLLAAGLPTPALAAAAPELPPAVDPADLRSLPTGRGLPVAVRTALFFVEIASFDENTGVFEATTDLRLAWIDPRLRYPPEESLNGYKEFRMSAAEAEIARLWTPQLRVLNREGEPKSRDRRLRLYPDGTVEIIERTTATYETSLDVTRFPFDRQSLRIELAVHEDTVESVDLIHRREDVEFTRVARDVAIDGWSPGLARLDKQVIRGWNGDRYAQVVATLEIRRTGGVSVATIFIPLFASMLIPFMVLWMNRASGDGFEIEAFELANVVIGGLFAVIALSFTISSAYPAIAAADNTVTRLIALNYVALAISLVITVGLYRFRWPARLLGGPFQREVFAFFSWAIPFLCLATAVALVLASAA
jgi:hypothetical protein